MIDRNSTGEDIDSYCTKCKLNLAHIIIAMVGATVVKVKCKTCGSIHRLKGTPLARSSSPKREVSAKTFVTNQALWEQAVSAAKGPELPYDMAAPFREGDLIMHSAFGKGVVQKALFKKCLVLFSDRERTLATSNT